MFLRKIDEEKKRNEKQKEMKMKCHKNFKEYRLRFDPQMLSHL